MKKIVPILLSMLIFISSYGFFVSAEILSIDAPDVSAKACILIEAKTGQVLYQKNAAKKMPMASTTKIMTTLLTLENGNLDDSFVVDSNAIMVEGSTMGLQQGDVVTLRTLCYGMMLPSGNDAANAAAIRVAGSYEKFAEMMNERAKEIGMTGTCFVSMSGLDAQGHGSTAKDMALLTREALRNPDFKEICSKQNATVQFGNPPYERVLTNTNKLLSMCDGVIGVKTGFTDDAGRCLVSACERNGITLICVTLNAPNDWQDHTSLYDFGFAQVNPVSTNPDEDLSVSVVGAKSDSLNLNAGEPITYGNADENYQDKITAKVIMPPFVYAPVNQGDYVGRIDYYYDGNFMDSVPLYAAETIGLNMPNEDVSTFQNIIGKIKSIFED